MFFDRTPLATLRHALLQLTARGGGQSRSGPDSRFAAVGVPNFQSITQSALSVHAAQTQNDLCRWTLSRRSTLHCARAERRSRKARENIVARAADRFVTPHPSIAHPKSPSPRCPQNLSPVFASSPR